jgi:hypothetical protein
MIKKIITPALSVRATLANAVVKFRRLSQSIWMNDTFRDVNKTEEAYFQLTGLAMAE